MVSIDPPSSPTPPSQPSPTPSSSNSSLSSTAAPSIVSKRKRSPSTQNSSIPIKSSKPSVPHNNQSASLATHHHHLAFDPFNPHPGFTKEERKLARMIRNRSAAQASRDRKKQHVAQLENRVKELETQLNSLSNGLSQPPASCPLPCCRAFELAPIREAGSIPAQVCLSGRSLARTTPTDSIDPSIINLDRSNLAPPSTVEAHMLAPSTPASNDIGTSIASPLPKTEPSGQSSVHPSPATILPPTQAEYLSKIRIDVLEQENAQLKNQIELETKRASRFKYQLLKSRLAAVLPLSTSAANRNQSRSDLAMDDRLIESMLTDEEIDRLLLSPSAPIVSVGPIQADPQSTVAMAQTTETSQASIDWDSLLNHSASPTPPNTFPSLPMFSAVPESSGLSSGSSTLDAFMRPSLLLSSSLNPTSVTPSSDQHDPQDPFANLLAPFVGPFSPSTPDPRLVAREVKRSPQRTGQRVEEGRLKTAVRELALYKENLWRQFPLTRLLTVLGQMVMCYLISCWVAWSSQTLLQVRPKVQAEQVVDSHWRDAVDSGTSWWSKSRMDGRLGPKIFRPMGRRRTGSENVMENYWLGRMQMDWG